MISVTRVFKFEAAHLLPGHHGKCKFLHGHSYKLEVEVVRAGKDTDKNGMVVDFGFLRNMIAPVIERLDHTYLNDVPGMASPPTAENLVKYIKEFGRFPDGIRPIRIRLWETENSFVEWREM